MTIRALLCRTAAIACLVLSIVSGAADAAEITVMSSGGFTAALKQLAPVYEKASGNTVHIVLGPSMGTATEAIPNRLARGETADLLIMVGYALDDLADKGVVKPDSRRAMAISKIGMVVRAGQPKPDIGTVEAFKKALLAARSIAYSDSASGVYIEAEMYKTLGLQQQLKGKSRMIVRDPVAGVVAKGEAEIGFQQVSELLPIPGVDFVGTIPDAVQKVTVFSAGIPAAAKQPAAGQALMDFLSSAEAAPTVVKTGLEPAAK